MLLIISHGTILPSADILYLSTAQLKLYVHIQHSCGDTIHSVFHHVHSTYIMVTTTVVTYIMQNISKTKDRVGLLQSSIFA